MGSEMCIRDSVGVACARGHGADALAWKCRYCCAQASFFCWGTTHFCVACHDAVQRGTLDTRRAPCAGPRACPLRCAHPPHGVEFCLGCTACRSEADARQRAKRPAAARAAPPRRAPGPAAAAPSFFDGLADSMKQAAKGAEDGFKKLFG